jgi:hypothetical protein
MNVGPGFSVGMRRGNYTLKGAPMNKVTMKPGNRAEVSDFVVLRARGYFVVATYRGGYFQHKRQKPRRSLRILDKDRKMASESLFALAERLKDVCRITKRTVYCSG